MYLYTWLLLQPWHVVVCDVVVSLCVVLDWSNRVGSGPERGVLFVGEQITMTPYKQAGRQIDIDTDR